MNLPRFSFYLPLLECSETLVVPACTQESPGFLPPTPQTSSIKPHLFSCCVLAQNLLTCQHTACVSGSAAAAVISVVSDSVWPHRQQPTRLLRLWDSPGKNTGVGCHFLLQCMKVKSEREVAQSCLTPRPHGLQPTRLLHPWDFPEIVLEWGWHRLLWCLALENLKSWKLMGGVTG